MGIYQSVSPGLITEKKKAVPNTMKDNVFRNGYKCFYFYVAISVFLIKL